MILRKRCDRGFTLVEIIITLMIVAVMGALYYNYMQQIQRSPLPSAQLTKSLTLQKVMVNIYADKKLSFPNNLIGMKSVIGNEGTTQNNGYGNYQVVANRFIKFVNYAETDIVTGDPQVILKVTIKNDQGESLSLLLTQ